MQDATPQYPFNEELVHAVSHGVGMILSVAGLVWMLNISIESSDPWRIVASCIYGFSLISLFLASTIYHTFYASRQKRLLKLIDHCAIYVFIAGTYTPFLLVAMRNDIGWWLFGAVWLLAAIGIAAKLWFRYRYPWLSLASYLVLGWLIVIAGPQMAEAIGSRGMMWLVAGGVSYTVGALFYMAHRLPFNHAIWHFFVLAGAIFHFLAVVWYVLPVSELVATGI